MICCVDMAWMSFKPPCFQPQAKVPRPRHQNSLSSQKIPFWTLFDPPPSMVSARTLVLQDHKPQSTEQSWDTGHAPWLQVTRKLFFGSKLATTSDKSALTTL